MNFTFAIKAGRFQITNEAGRLVVDMSLRDVAYILLNYCLGAGNWNILNH